MAKHKVCKSGMVDVRVDFCHLDPKSRERGARGTSWDALASD